MLSFPQAAEGGRNRQYAAQPARSGQQCRTTLAILRMLRLSAHLVLQLPLSTLLVLQRRQQKVDVTITTLKAGVVRVEDSEESLYASIDLVCDKVARKLRKVKERLMQQGAWPGKGGPRVNTEEEEFKVGGGLHKCCFCNSYH